jgi:hypothetical protein
MVDFSAMSTSEHARPDPAGSSGETQSVGPSDERVVDGLSRREREVLAFERQWWKHAGSKEAAVRELFGLSATRYYQLLNALIDRPEALRADPLLVKRLRRLRASRAKARVARRLGIYDLDR